MAQMTMYPVKDGSPQTTTITILSDSAIVVSVAELACFPDVGAEGANLITFWDDTTYETCEYTAKSSASGSGTLDIVRSGARHSSTSGGGIEWPPGTKCARTGTGYDFTAIKNNIEDHEIRIGSLDTRITGIEGMFESEGIVYGLLWNRASSSPSLQRIDENGDILTLTSTNFDNHPLWGGMKRCSLTAAGVPTYGSNNRGDGLTLTNDYVMVEIPLAYAGAYREGDYQGILLSDQPFSSKYCVSERHPAFWRRDRSGTRASKLYLGSYEASNNGGTVSNDGTTATKYATSWTNLKLTSKSGTAPLTGNATENSGTMAQFESAAKLIGTNWGIQSFWTQCLLQSLFYIEYASFNSQSALAPGLTKAENTSALASGSGNSLMGTNGTGGGTDTQAVCYRGIENPWGNIWKFIIGFNSIDSAYNVMKRDGTGALAAVLAAGNYEQTSGITPLNGTSNISGTDGGEYCHGYASDLIFSDPLKLAFIPSALSGSETTYLPDYYYSHKAGISQTGCLLAGGGWYNAGRAGVGSLIANSAAASHVSSYFGARLEFLG